MKHLKIISVIIFLLCGVAQQAGAVVYSYVINTKNAVVYEDTLPKSKKLGKLPFFAHLYSDHDIYVFEKTENWAKIRFQKQWGYIKTKDIYTTYPINSSRYWEVTANNASIYKDATLSKKITSLKKGTVIGIEHCKKNISKLGYPVYDSIDFKRQVAFVEYDINPNNYSDWEWDRKNGFIELATIQPLPKYYEVIAQPVAKTYIKPNINSTIQNRILNCGDTIFVSHENKNWVSSYDSSDGYYVRLRDLKPLPDNDILIADKHNEQEIEYMKEAKDSNKIELTTEKTIVWAILIITFLLLILPAFLSEYKLTIRFIGIYIIAILVLIFMVSSPDLPNPFQSGILDKHWWQVMGLYAVALCVLGCVFWQIICCYYEVKDNENTFVAILSVAFPAGVIGFSILFGAFFMFIFALPLAIIMFMAVGEGGSSSSVVEKSNTETIYGPDGIETISNGSILYTRSGDTLYKNYDGTYSTSDGKQHYRKNARSDNSSKLDKID